MKEPWIDSSPDVLAGKPRVRGTRISVTLILELLAEGLSIDQVLTEYPQLEREAVVAALHFAAALAETPTREPTPV